jgi:hypothetical protein
MPRSLLRQDAVVACRQIWIWLLALSMAFQSVSAAIVGVTGVQHKHVTCAAPAEEPEPTGAEGFFLGLLHSVLGEAVTPSLPM